jgi:hypothetical protein
MFERDWTTWSKFVSCFVEHLKLRGLQRNHLERKKEDYSL